MESIPKSGRTVPSPAERDRWDAWAPTYDRSLWQPLFFRRVHSLLVSAVGAVRQERVVDVGCGTGSLARLLNRRGATVVGTDASPGMVLQAATNTGGDGPRFVAGAAEHLPFEDGAFGAAVSAISAHHWVDPARGIRELRRVVRPGGRVVIADAGRIGPVAEFIRRICVANVGHHPGWNAVDLGALLQDAGFEEVRYREIRILGIRVVILAAAS